jgi:hypothetical protein
VLNLVLVVGKALRLYFLASNWIHSDKPPVYLVGAAECAQYTYLTRNCQREIAVKLHFAAAPALQFAAFGRLISNVPWSYFDE